MGVSTDGILAYGYDLGGGEDEWHIAEVAEYEPWHPAWLEADEDGDYDYVDAVEKRLLASIGFTETDWEAEGYFDRMKAAKERVGVELVIYCSFEYPIYLLAAHRVTVARGYVQEIDWAALDAMRVEQDWDDKLRAALAKLGITPTQPEPRWLLVSLMG